MELISELESRLTKIFNLSNLDEQPDYITIINFGNGKLIKNLYECIMSKTIRGNHLKSHPLKMIRIDKSKDSIAIAQTNVSEFPCLFNHVKKIDSAELYKKFLENNISKEKVLNIFLNRNPKQRIDNLENYWWNWEGIIGVHGIIVVENIFNPKVDEVVLNFEKTFRSAIENNFLPKISPQKIDVKKSGDIFMLTHYFKKTFKIRQATIEDIEKLIQLEEACWGLGSQLSKKEIINRILIYPKGQFIIEEDKNILGVVYSQRIQDKIVLANCKVDSVSKLHIPSGKIVQLLSINIFPKYQSKGLGDDLLEFMLQLSALIENVQTVCAISKCRDFKGSTLNDYQSYIDQKDEFGFHIDPILKFHHMHGATIDSVIENYRPNDKENLGHGVLVNYDIKNRKRFTGIKKTGSKHLHNNWNRAEIKKEINSYLDKLLNSSGINIQNYTLMEMGLDSGDLAGFSIFISKTFDIEFPTLLFFEINTIELVVTQIIELLEEILDDPTTNSKEKGLDSSNDLMIPDALLDNRNIAIVGYSFRVPGAINEEELWDVLKNGKSTISETPENRWNWPEWINKNTTHRGIDKGGYLSDIDTFDTAFFKITPREAELMDPQQRILLELTWELLEAAGYRPSNLKGTKTGVFIGASGSDYDIVLNENCAPSTLTGTGGAVALLPNRISYFYDFNGPSMLIDTACSSSMFAFHKAVESLRLGECNQAVVGGIHLMCHPSKSLAYFHSKMLSRDGTCKTFDEKANGYVRGEGAILMLLKPAKRAFEDGDDIKGIIRGSSINHGGHSGGLTVPNSKRQGDLLIQACQDANIDIKTLRYIEAHGTGTPLGDPIEIKGWSYAYKRMNENIYSNNSNLEFKCGIGSIKSNIGHLEAASGIVGVLKVLLSMKYGILCPTINFNKINPKIDFSETPLYIQDKLERIESKIWRAGISSFGIGGANGHVILESFPETYAEEKSENNSTVLLFFLSAKNEKKLKEYAEIMHGFISKNISIDLRALSYSSYVSKEAMNERLVIVFNSANEILDALRSYINDISQDNYIINNIRAVNNITQIVEEKFSELIKERAYYLIAELWCKGVVVDYGKLYTEKKFKKICLPAYPFEKEKYWVPLLKPQITKIEVNEIHPFFRDSYSKGHKHFFCFSGKESFLEHHKINGERVLPGVAYLELVFEAVIRNTGKKAFQFNEVLWERSISFENERKEIFVDFKHNNTQIDFEVSEIENNPNKINCSGKISFSFAQMRGVYEIQQIKNRLSKVRKRSECYTLFRSLGLNYGPSFSCIQNVFYNDFEILGEINFDIEADYTLQPGVLDAVFQTCIALNFGESNQALELPYSVKQIDIAEGTSNARWCYVRKNINNNSKILSYDIDLMDKDGKILMRFKEFIMLPAQPFKNINRAQFNGEHNLKQNNARLYDNLIFAPNWKNLVQSDTTLDFAQDKCLVINENNLIKAGHDIITLLKNNYVDIEIVKDLQFLPNEISNVYLLHGLSDVSTEIAAASRIETVELSLFRTIKKIFEIGGNKRNIHFTILTYSTQKVLKNDKIQTSGAGISGLIGALSKECPNWKIRIVDLPNESLNDEDLKSILSVSFENPVSISAFRNRTIFKMKLSAINVQPRQTILKENGVYIILGGAGGLGIATTEYLIKKYDAQIIWLGRSALNQSISEKLEAFESLGKKPYYIQCDANNKRIVQQTFTQIKEQFDSINGLFHSAMVLNDMLIEKMTEQDFIKSFYPKSIATHNLIEIFGSESLDFICFYSSILSQITSGGQSNYAAGCTYKDALGHAFEQSNSTTPIKIINWGYWSEVGIVSSVYYQKKMESIGIGSIKKETSLELMDNIISSDLTQVTIANFILGKEHILNVVDQENNIQYTNSSAKINPSDFTIAKYDNVELESKIDEICLKKLVQLFLEIGLEDHLDSYESEIKLRKKLAIIDKYEKLFQESIRILLVNGYLKKIGNRLSFEKTHIEDIEHFDLDKELDLIVQENQDFKAHCHLLSTTLNSFKQIILGDVLATEVIFPKGSMVNVSGIYRGNYKSDYFNKILSQVLLNNITADLNNLSKRQDKIKILEIGAGTGGTSQRLFEAFKPYSSQLEYWYTDVSKSFLIHAETEYRDVAPYMKTELFNIERPPEDQNIPTKYFDVVVGTNVVHATKNIKDTLYNIKKLLKQDGLFLMNELARTDIYDTVTFGLLDGWWLFEDQEIRMEGGPALSSNNWDTVLKESGFSQIQIFPFNSNLSQQVISSKSNGQSILKNSPYKKSDNLLHMMNGNKHSALSKKERSINYLKGIFSKVLKMDVLKINPRTPFEDIGIDSILIGALVGEISETFKSISTTIFFEFNTLDELADYLVDNYPNDFADNSDSSEPSSESMNNRATNESSSFEKADNSHNGFRKDIAIIGLSGKYPSANNVNELWENLKMGKDCVVEIPKERWDVDLYFDKTRGKEGKINSKYGGFIDGVDEFDPLFFNISPLEAEKMDPQERLFLQTTWAAIEDSGYSVQSLSKQSDAKNTVRTGVYVGVMYEEYQLYSRYSSCDEQPTILGWSPSSIANRVSYICNFEGPSLAVDTMCSSSLTSIHLACNDIRNGDVDIAIAGGVNVSIHPNKYVMLSEGTFLSSRGKCESFGDKGEGFIPSEGVGAVVLKSLKKAEKDGDQIYAVIKGTHINHGGKARGFTVPNPNSQASVIKESIRKAGVNPEEISYIETHGTGTILGDPIEIAGLNKAFNSQNKQYCSIGSIKSNIGHCESAAGIAGLTKVLLQLKHKKLVPSIHSKTLNPNIDFKNSPFKVQQVLENWTTRNNQLRIAGISGFGAGGSNAHIVVEEYRAKKKNTFINNEPSIILISAKNKDRLLEQIKNLKNYLELHKALNIADIAYTLQIGRQSMENRFAMIASKKDDLILALSNYIEGKDGDFLVGNIKKNNKDSLLEDDSLNSYVNFAIQNKELKSLIQFWIKGMKINWGLLYNNYKPNKISLPTYPFEKKRYWFTKTNSKENILAQKNHPLVHSNISTLLEQKYLSIFSGKENFFADHVVRGNKILPGVAYLELAREAGAKALNEKVVGLKDITWLAPLESSNTSAKVSIHLWSKEKEVSYEIVKESKSELYCQGKLTTNIEERPKGYSLTTLKGKFSNKIISDEFYKQFEEIGIKYGSSFKGLSEIYLNKTQALSKINLSSQNEYAFDPAVLDSALQNIVFLNYEKQGLSLPFTLRKVSFFKKLPKTFWSYARKTESTKICSFDIDLLNETGEVLVSFRDFSLLPLNKKKEKNKIDFLNTSLNVFKREWKEKPINPQLPTFESNEIDTNIFLIDSPYNLAEQLKYELELNVEVLTKISEEDYFTSLLMKFKEKINNNSRSHFMIVCSNEDYLKYHFLTGLLKTAQKENSKISWKFLGVDTLSIPHLLQLKEIINLEIKSFNEEVRYFNNRRLVKVSEILSNTNSPKSFNFKRGGIYWITGGTGGLGFVFAKYLAEKYDAKLILTGRNILDEKKKRMLSKIPNAYYYQCDISNRVKALSFFKEIKESFTNVNGILHCAGVSANNFIMNKETTEVNKVFAPKIDGMKNIDFVTRNEALDIIVLFSSIAGILPMAGQSDYAAANAFLDSYAEYRNSRVSKKQRHGITISINWPLWKETGMRVDEETITMLENQWGMLPMDIDSGIRAFEKIIEQGLVNGLVTYGYKKQISEIVTENINPKFSKNNSIRIDKKLINNDSFKNGNKTLENNIEPIKNSKEPLLVPKESTNGDLSLSTQVEKTLLQMTAKFLKLEESKIDVEMEFKTFGMDSILLTRFSNKLNTFYNIDLIPTVFYNFSAIRDLAAYLVNEYETNVKERYITNSLINES